MPDIYKSTKRTPKEDRLQTACVKWFDLQYPELSMLLHHSPNGGKRDAAEAAKFKRMGVRAGFPDLILLVPRHGYICLAIELKAQTGRQSEFQKRWQGVAEKNNIAYCIIKSVDNFIDTISMYLSDAPSEE